MSRFERVPWGLHPLSEVDGKETNGIALDLKLPDYVEKQKIGVNIGVLRTEMRWGGIRKLTVTGTSGETSRFTPTIVMGRLDGNPYAGTIGEAKIVPTYSTQRKNPNNFNQPNFIAGRWTDVTMEINLNEVMNRITQKKKPLLSTEAWSRELDYAIRSGVAREGMEHLIFDATSGEKFLSNFDTFNGIISGGIFSEFIPNLSPIEGMTINTLILHGISNIAFRRVYSKKGYDTEGFRWSLFTGPQIDRAVLLHGMSKGKRVIKPISRRKLQK